MFGDWCSGNTSAFGAAILGSNPRSPASFPQTLDMGGFGGGIFSGPSLLAMQQQQNSLANAQQDALRMQMGFTPFAGQYSEGSFDRKTRCDFCKQGIPLNEKFHRCPQNYVPANPPVKKQSFPRRFFRRIVTYLT